LGSREERFYAWVESFLVREERVFVWVKSFLVREKRVSGGVKSILGWENCFSLQKKPFLLLEKGVWAGKKAAGGYDLYELFTVVLSDCRQRAVRNSQIIKMPVISFRSEGIRGTRGVSNNANPVQ